MRALLDTCTFLWLAFEPARISPAARDVLNDPGNERTLSHASTLEIVLKHRAGKLPLPAPPDEWIPSRRDFFHVQALSMEEPVIFRAGQLPDGHDDPFDRLLAAQALEAKLTLLSPDAPLSTVLGATRIW